MKTALPFWTAEKKTAGFALPARAVEADIAFTQTTERSFLRIIRKTGKRAEIWKKDLIFSETVL